MTLAATVALDQAALCPWDAIVIGAGPAGALAARQAARDGLRTLLVDGKRFPREKVCGGCLNGRAVAALRRAGLEQELARSNGMPLDSLRLVVRGRHTVLALPPGLAVSRVVFDAELVQAAIEGGASFLPATQAVVQPELAADGRGVVANRQARRRELTARVVVAADGLSRSSLKRLPAFKSHIARHSRVGVGASVECGGADYPGGQIAIVVARTGYVGLTRIGSDRLNVAAALDPAALQLGRSIAELVTHILVEAGMPTPAGLAAASWQGTPPLTSRPGRVAAERLLVIGDAAGYVEPFTGEGMAAALESALAIGSLVREAGRDWRPSLAAAWETMHQKLVGARQGTCRALAWTLRRPWTASAALGVCRAFPSTADRLISRVNQLPPQRASA